MAQALRPCPGCGQLLVQLASPGNCPVCGTAQYPSGYKIQAGYITSGIVRPDGYLIDGNHELELREHYRRLADEHVMASIEKMLADREWQPGRCTGCGLSDKLVKGPPGAQLCTYCDELRILAPVQDAKPAEKRPVKNISFALLVAAVIVGFLPWPVAWASLALFALAVLLA